MDDARSRPVARGAWPDLGLAAIAAIQAVLVAWWLIIPLPNAVNSAAGQDPAKPPRRGLILLGAVPHVVPGVTWAASGVGRIADEWKHPETLSQRIPILLAALLIAAAGLGIGDGVLRALRLREGLARGERIPLAFGLGMIGLASGTLILGRLGLLHRPLIVGLLAIAAGAGLMSLRRGPQIPPRAGRGAWIAFALISGPFVVLMALASALPTFDFDAVEYHLQGPKEFYLAGRIAFLPHNVYTSMPFGVEMLHLLGMICVGGWWKGASVGQVVVMLHAPAAAALVYLAASRLASPRAGWIAALIYLTTPWVYRLAAIPYVEGPMLYYHAAALWAMARSREPRWWCVAGLLAGGAMTCKYPAFVSAVVPFGLVALATRSPRAVGLYALGVSLAIGPWLAKNIIDTGNPVYPLAWKLLGGSPWDAAREAKWQNAHGPRPPSWGAAEDGLLDIAGRSDWQTILFAALAPLALWRRDGRRASAFLFLYSAYVFGTWFFLTHRLDRFWLPVLPPLAILAGRGADCVRSRAWTAWLVLLIGVVTFTNFFYATSPLTALNEWTGDLAKLPVEIPRRMNEALAAVDETLPPDARILLVGQAAVFHLKHPVIYNTVFDDEILETLARDRSPEEVRRALVARGVTHVFVDWPEIARHRKPGGYGFTGWVRPEVFAGLERAGVLAKRAIPVPETDRELYAIAPR